MLQKCFLILKTHSLSCFRCFPALADLNQTKALPPQHAIMCYSRNMKDSGSWEQGLKTIGLRNHEKDNRIDRCPEDTSTLSRRSVIPNIIRWLFTKQCYSCKVEWKEKLWRKKSSQAAEMTSARSQWGFVASYYYHLPSWSAVFSAVHNQYSHLF